MKNSDRKKVINTLRRGVYIMDNSNGHLDITKKLSTFGWKVEGMMATSVFAKLGGSDTVLYRYSLDFIYKSAIFEMWKDGKRISQKDLDYNAILEKALENKI